MIITKPQAKRVVITIFCGTATLISIVLIILPEPAFVVIPIGFSILASEFFWARHWLNNVPEFTTRFKFNAAIHKN